MGEVTGHKEFIPQLTTVQFLYNATFGALSAHVIFYEDCLFCCFTSQVNSYDHGRTVSSPNHTFIPGQA